MIGSCPACKKGITHLDGNAVDARLSPYDHWKAITYNCPFCYVVLGVQIDPIAVKTDTVNAILEQLRKH